VDETRAAATAVNPALPNASSACGSARSTRTRPALCNAGASRRDFSAALGGLTDSLLRACPAQCDGGQIGARDAPLPSPACGGHAPAAILRPDRLHAPAAPPVVAPITKPPPVASVPAPRRCDGCVGRAARRSDCVRRAGAGRGVSALGDKPNTPPAIARNSRRPPPGATRPRLLAAFATPQGRVSKSLRRLADRRPPRRRLPRRRAKFLLWRLEDARGAGQGARTTLLPRSITTVRATRPGRSRAGKIPPGQVFLVLRPSAPTSVAWYRIDGRGTGRRVERLDRRRPDDNYWFEPVDRRPGDLPPAPAAAYETGSKAASPGAAAAEPGARRAAHGGDYLGQLQPGARIHRDLSAGLRRPAAWWWLVRMGDLDGWMAEGAGGDYY